MQEKNKCTEDTGPVLDTVIVLVSAVVAFAVTVVGLWVALVVLVVS